MSRVHYAIGRPVRGGTGRMLACNRVYKREAASTENPEDVTCGHCAKAMLERGMEALDPGHTERERRRRWKLDEIRTRAYSGALGQLRDRHRDEFDAIMAFLAAAYAAEEIAKGVRL